MGRARDIANVLSSSTNIALDSELGLSLITPTSVSTSGGSSTISSTGAVSFTSASAISLNGCFSSTYNNYKIKMDSLYGSSDSINIVFRLRKSGTDNSDSSSYRRRGFVADASALSNQIETGTNFYITTLNSSSNAPAFVEYDLFLPFVNTQTGLNKFTYRSNDDAINSAVGRHIIVDTYDGCSFIMSSGTMTGTLRVYGYRN